MSMARVEPPQCQAFVPKSTAYCRISFFPYQTFVILAFSKTNPSKVKYFSCFNVIVYGYVITFCLEGKVAS